MHNLKRKVTSLYLRRSSILNKKTYEGRKSHWQLKTFQGPKGKKQAMVALVIIHFVATESIGFHILVFCSILTTIRKNIKWKNGLICVNKKAA